MGKAARRKRERTAQDRSELYEQIVAQGPPAEVVDPRPEEARTFDILYQYDRKAPLWLSTPALKNLCRMARECGMSRLLDAEIEKELEPSAKHMVLWAARHWSNDFKHDNVRAKMAIGTKTWMAQGPDWEPIELTLDLPTRQFAMLCFLSTGPDNNLHSTPHARRLAQLASDLDHDINDEIGVRKWTGTRSMDHVASGLMVHWHLLAGCEVYGTSDGLREHFLSLGWPLNEANEAVGGSEGPRPVLGSALLREMRSAHPIVCEPEWVQALDDFKDWDEAFDISRELRLPFESIYLDVRGPGGYNPLIPVTRVGENKQIDPQAFRREHDGFDSARLSGGLVWRDSGSNRLHIGVFGAPGLVPERKDGFHNIDPLGFGADDFLGTVTFNVETPAPWGSAQISIEDSTVTRDALTCAPYGEGPRGMSLVKMPARVVLPFGHEQLQRAFPQYADEFAHLWASITWAAARRILRTVFMLQAGNVELVDAQVSRQVRRQGQREGNPISKQVVVRLNRKTYARPPGMEEGTVDWSHAWWVSGHPRYYPIGTRKADAQPPEKLINHPEKGLCFMEWVPPYIKGNRDKGVVEKTRVVRDRRCK